MKRCKRTLMLVSLWNQCWSLNDTLKYPLFLDVLMFSLITICFLSLHFVLNYAVQAQTNQLEKDYKEKEGTVNHSFCAVCMMLWFSFLYIFFVLFLLIVSFLWGRTVQEITVPVRQIRARLWEVHGAHEIKQNIFDGRSPVLTIYSCFSEFQTLDVSKEFLYSINCLVMKHYGVCMTKHCFFLK